MLAEQCFMSVIEVKLFLFSIIYIILFPTFHSYTICLSPNFLWLFIEVPVSACS